MIAASRPYDPLVAVVIVGYNETDLVCGCLRSLARIEHRPLLVIYIDNASPEGTLARVQAEFPDVVAIASGGNLGYCGGNNIGIDRALAAGAEYVLILNPDTVVCNPGFVRTLVGYLDQHPRVGKVGPKVYLREYGLVQNTVLEWPRVVANVRDVFGGRDHPGRHPHSAALTVPTEVQALNGCCLFVRAAAFRDVGNYDDSFWGYVDEADWDWRAEQRGWKRHYVPVESIIHLQRKDGYDFGSRADFLIKRNTAAWYLKTRKFLSLLAWIGLTLGMVTARMLLAPFRGGSLRTHAAFLGKLAAAYGRILMALPGRIIGRETRWCA